MLYQLSYAPRHQPLRPPHGSEVSAGRGRSPRRTARPAGRRAPARAARPARATSDTGELGPVESEPQGESVGRRWLGAERTPGAAGRAARDDGCGVRQRACAHRSRRREAERVEHVLERGRGRRARAQQRVDALAERRPGRAGHREHIASQRERVIGGDQRARATRRLDHDRDARERRDQAVADREPPGGRLHPRRPTPRRARRTRRSAAASAVFWRG